MLLSLFLLASSVLASRLTNRVITSGPVLPYVLRYAPLIHLWSRETWWPSQLNTHLAHCVANLDYATVAQPIPLTIGNLDFQNVTNMFTKSLDNVESNPAWLLSAYGIPNPAGLSASASTIIMVDKANIIGPGYVDVFYYMFYSYNHGNKVLGTRFGNHVGDWESVMTRYLNGVPEAHHLSQHSEGAAYTYTAMEKNGIRPVAYSAGGTHANYATAGKQNYKLPLGLLSDTTDAGPLWDLAANYSAFWYSTSRGFVPARGNKSPTNFLDYVGHWGDKQYTNRDSRQNCIFGQCHYENGPVGPVIHNLVRYGLCERSNCTPATSI